jgi:capsular polysaccharide biosynthesis protein
VISRRHAPGRRVANEEEMMRLLSRLGFVAHVLEELSFTEQVRLFASAKIVVAPHGAGLANMVFSDGLSVVELFSSYFNASFLTLAASLGFRYGCLECKPVRTIHPKRDDMMVDLDGLDDLIRRMTSKSLTYTIP